MNTSAPVTASNEILLRSDAGGVATLTLNRPKQFNALSMEMLDALQAALDAIAGDPAVRVVVIAANGKAFCPGHDLKEMLANRTQEFVGALFDKCCKVMLSITRMPQPVIARVHGIATAAGCQLVGGLRSRGGVDRRALCHLGHQFRAVLRHSRRRGFAQRFAQAGAGNADDRRVHRCRRPRSSGAWSTASRRRINSTTRCGNSPTCCCPNHLPCSPPARSFFYRQIEMDMEPAYKLASQVITDNMLGRTRSKASAPLSRNANPNGMTSDW